MADAAPAPAELSTKTEIPADERGVLIPKNLSQSVAFANLIIKGGQACIPRGLQRPNPQEQIATLVIAMQYGADLGLTPMKALRSVMVVNGLPGIYGEGPAGIVESRGLLEDAKDEWSGKPFADDWTVTVTLKRKGRTSPTVRSFSWLQAKKAGLTEKQGPWKNYPERMMYHRAKTFAYRDAFPDIIGGFMSEDEADEIRSATLTGDTPPQPGQTVETGPKRGRKKAAADSPPTVDADFTVGGAPVEPEQNPAPEGGGTNEMTDAIPGLPDGSTYCGRCTAAVGKFPEDKRYHAQGEGCPTPPQAQAPAKAAEAAPRAPAQKAAAATPAPNPEDPFGGLFDGGKG